MRTMTQDQIIATLRYAAMLERTHQSITYEYGVVLVNLVADFGDRLADALERADERYRLALEDIASGHACLSGYSAADAAAAARQALAPRIDPPESGEAGT